MFILGLLQILVMVIRNQYLLCTGAGVGSQTLVDAAEALAELSEDSDSGLLPSVVTVVGGCPEVAATTSIPRGGRSTMSMSSTPVLPNIDVISEDEEDGAGSTEATRSCDDVARYVTSTVTETTFVHRTSPPPSLSDSSIAGPSVTRTDPPTDLRSSFGDLSSAPDHIVQMVETRYLPASTVTSTVTSTVSPVSLYSIILQVHILILISTRFLLWHLLHLLLSWKAWPICSFMNDRVRPDTNNLVRMTLWLVILQLVYSSASVPKLWTELLSWTIVCFELWLKISC